MQQSQGGGSRVMNFGKSRARLHDSSRRRVTFNDVAGADEEKAELVEIVVNGSTSTGEPFTLPGDTFSLDILFGGALGQQTSGLPNPVLSNPDPNTYLVDFTADGGYVGSYTVTVVSTEEIQGAMNLSVSGCTINMPFTVNRTGD